MSDMKFFPNETVFDANLVFETSGSIPAAVREFAIELVELPRGKMAANFGSYEGVLENGPLRAAGFHTAIDEANARLRQAGVDRELLHAASCELVIAVALVIEEGDGGLEIGADTLGEWSRLGARLLINAWPGDFWAPVEATDAAC